MIPHAPITLALFWRPFIAPTPLLLLAAAVGVLAVWVGVRTYRRHRGLSVTVCAMRLLLVGAVTTILMGPSTMPQSSTEPGRSSLTVMLDLSASMQTNDMLGATRIRYALDHWLTDNQLAELQASHELLLIGFDSNARRIGPELRTLPDGAAAAGQTSRIARLVTDTIASMPQPAQSQDAGTLVLISDGRDTASDPFQTPARYARNKGIPIHTVTLGASSISRDIAVVAQPRQPYLLVGEAGTVTVRIIHANVAGMSTRVTLSTVDGPVIDEREVRFEEGAPVTLDFPITHDDPGSYAYRVSAEPLAGETIISNNSQPVFVDVTDKRMQVLILEGEPYWDTKFLAHALRLDERIGVTQITQVAEGRSETILTRAEAVDSVLPRGVEDFAAYDVVVLGKSLENLLGPEAIAALPAYVSDHGGRVVFARGRAVGTDDASKRDNANALAALEPVVWGEGVSLDVALAITPEGALHPGLLSARGGLDEAQLAQTLPALLRLPRVLRAKPAASVLAEARPQGMATAQGQPALAIMPYGDGMVLAVLGDGLWKWRLAASRDPSLLGVYDRFWAGMVRWLVMGSDYVPGQELSLRLATRSVQVGQTMTFDVTSRTPLDTEAVTATVTDSAGQSHRVALQPVAGSPMRHRGSLDVQSAGVHTVSVAPSPQPQPPDQTPLLAQFNAYELDQERLHNAANPQAMRSLAELSGGRVLDPTRPGDLLAVLEQQRTAMIVPPRAEYVWDHGGILALLLLWAGAEWIIRKQGGLL